MVNVVITGEMLLDWFVNLAGPLFDKLGLPAFVFYLHSAYIFTMAILAVLAIVVLAVVLAVKKLRKPEKKTAAKKTTKKTAAKKSTKKKEA